MGFGAGILSALSLQIGVRHSLQSSPVTLAPALVHDWLNQLGGAEDVLNTFHGMFPRSPVFTSIYDRARMPQPWRGWDIRSTWLDQLPGIHRHHQPYMPLFAWAWSRTRIPHEHDLILSNKSAFCIGAHGSHPSVKHICYCLTPTRFTYDYNAYADRERIPAGASAILRTMNALLTRWETRAAQHVTHFIAISREVSQRIQNCYNRESTIIYPPVEMPADKSHPLPYSALRGPGQVLRDVTSHTIDGGFYLVVSRLLPYKRVDLAIEACAQMNVPLVIAGDGRDRARLQALADLYPNANAKLMGRVDDSTLGDLLSRCTAFLFPGFEDFGIAPIRAMAYGKPVIAFGRGGALDTIIDGQTGTLFYQQTVEALIDAIQKNSKVTFAPVLIRQHAQQFSTERFVAEMSEFLDRHL